MFLEYIMYYIMIIKAWQKKVWSSNLAHEYF